MSRPARAFINTAALKHNLNQARQFHPNRKIMAVIKANGYGHGIVAVASALSDADGFGVASLEEAMTLRDAGVALPQITDGFTDNAPDLGCYELGSTPPHWKDFSRRRNFLTLSITRFRRLFIPRGRSIFSSSQAKRDRLMSG